MAFQVLKDCKLYLAGYNLSSFSNKLGLKYSAEILDKTVFGASSKGRIPGLLDVSLDGGGFFDADADFGINDKLAVADTLVTVCPTDGAAGEVAFMFPALLAEYSPGGAVGELFAFEISASGCDVLARGTVLENAVKTATATGTARNLGIVGAAQKLYAGMHVLAVSGTSPTLNMIIQSDDAEVFLSPISRVTFAQKTAIGSEWATPVAGGISDSWWRCYYTIGGTTPSFTVVVVVAIQ